MVAELMAKAIRPTNWMPTAAQALEFRREQYGLNQSEFAMVLGLTKSHYSEIVSGKRQLTLEAASRAFAIGVPPDSIFGKEWKK